MKKPSKIILKLLNLIVLLILFGCEKDLYEEPIHQSKINVEKVSLKDSKSSSKIHPNLLKAVSKVHSKNNIEIGKIVYDSINNIYFDDELGIKITNEDHESYTFKIIKEGGKLENILFTKNEYNEFDVFKLKYDFTEVELILLNFQDIKPKEVINLTSSDTANKFIVITFLVSLCNHNPYDCGGFHCGFEEVTFSMWIDDSIGIGSNGGGGGSGGSGGGGGGSGGGGSANNPNSNTNSIELPILTMPVHGIQPSQTPCETLRDVIQNAKVALAIQALAPKTLLKSESAYQIERKYSSQTQTYTYTTTLKEGDNFNTTVQVGGYIKGQAHNHPENGQSIPSITDLKWLSACQENIYPASANAYNIVVCPNPASPNDPSTAIIYAVTVDNLENLTNQMNTVFGADFDTLTADQQRELIKEINDKYAEKFGDVQNSAAGMEKKFLELYATFGISLYKFDDNANNWNKLNLQNNTVTPQPCEE
jgi:hypothetical protein